MVCLGQLAASYKSAVLAHLSGIVPSRSKSVAIGPRSRIPTRSIRCRGWSATLGRCFRLVVYPSWDETAGAGGRFYRLWCYVLETKNNNNDWAVWLKHLKLSWTFSLPSFAPSSFSSSSSSFTLCRTVVDKRCLEASLAALDALNNNYYFSSGLLEVKFSLSNDFLFFFFFVVVVVVVVDGNTGFCCLLSLLDNLLLETLYYLARFSLLWKRTGALTLIDYFC